MGIMVGMQDIYHQRYDSSRSSGGRLSVDMEANALQKLSSVQQEPRFNLGEEKPGY